MEVLRRKNIIHDDKMFLEMWNLTGQNGTDTAMQTLIPNLHTSTKKMIRDILQTVMDQAIIKFCLFVLNPC